MSYSLYVARQKYIRFSFFFFFWGGWEGEGRWMGRNRVSKRKKLRGKHLEIPIIRICNWLTKQRNRVVSILELSFPKAFEAKLQMVSIPKG